MFTPRYGPKESQNIGEEITTISSPPHPPYIVQKVVKILYSCRNQVYPTDIVFNESHNIGEETT